ncbi:unnamed protein product [Hydatigera taeniaeformis]|uniref:BZIP domain-containing protein n=1 Tax=Hydatigena taeniaeformis TaxID=6205 RepID=A0A0R3WZX2_HYDTA|nr:unnamed protein product [Hydatigera taeniaeformis]
MFSGVDLHDESSSFPFDDLVGVVNDADFTLDLGPQDIFEDPNLDLCLFGIPDGVPLEPVVDNSDSDSGISNHGDKLQPSASDIERGSLNLSDLDASTNAHPPVTELVNITSTETTVSKTLSPQPKRPRPSEPLITGSHDTAAPSALVSLTPAFSDGASLVKPELCGYTSTIRQIPSPSHMLPKIPRILSRGQSCTSRNVAPQTRVGCVYQPGGYDNTALREQERHGALVPAVVSLPVIDEFTFSNSFRVISPPTESESFEKLVKKQERMIKNRQAACLSRLRKKEYLERLENRLTQLRQENAHLRQENNEWRHRYDHLERCLGDLQAEFATLRRASETSSEGVGKLSISSPSPRPAVCSPSSPPQHHSSPQLKRPLLVSTTSPISVVSKVPLLRKQNVERTMLQKSGQSGGFLSNDRIIGGVGLPRGVRKKVTTSLFVVVCLFLMNFSITPLGQLGSSLTMTLSGSKNVGIMSSSDYEDILMKAPLGGRILLSASPVEGVKPAIQSSRNQTSVPQALGEDVGSKVNTTANDSGIERCLPGSFLDPQGELVWILFDEDDEITDWPLYGRRKRLAHYRHGQDVAEPPSKWRVTKSHRFGRVHRRRLHKAYLLRSSQDKSGAGWREDGLPDSLYLFGQSTSSNLTIFSVMKRRNLI